MVYPQKDRNYNYLSYLFGWLLEIILAQTILGYMSLWGASCEEL